MKDKVVDGTLHLTAEGTASARPDVAELDVGVFTEGKTASDAVAENARRMTAVIAALHDLGVAKDDLQTSGFALSPMVDPEPKNPTFGKVIGWRADDGLRVRADVALAGKVLDAAVKSGANLASGLRFALRDDTALKAQALQAAMAAAKSQAEGVATALGAKLDPPHVVEITSVGNPGPFYRNARTADAVTPVEPGTITARANVRVEQRYRAPRA